MGRYYPACECIGSVAQYDYLGCLLGDDGGLGLDSHIPMLREGREMCRRVLAGCAGIEYWVTECFSADIAKDAVWIYDNRDEPSGGVKYRLDALLPVLDRWIAFLEHGVQTDGGLVIMHADLQGDQPQQPCVQRVEGQEK